MSNRAESLDEVRELYRAGKADLAAEKLIASHEEHCGCGVPMTQEEAENAVALLDADPIEAAAEIMRQARRR